MLQVHLFAFPKNPFNPIEADLLPDLSTDERNIRCEQKSEKSSSVSIEVQEFHLFQAFCFSA